jgi:hypothetical protein
MRHVHDDIAGPALTPEQLELQKALIDIEAKAIEVETRLRTLLEKRPDLRRPHLLMPERLRDLSRWLAGMRDARKGAGL